VFRFCAIPQVMAIATLAELYNNPQVFTGVVKIRKCQAAQLILDTKTMDGLHKWMNVLTRQILYAVPKEDPSAEKTISICNTVLKLTDERASRAKVHGYALTLNVAACAVLATSGFCVFVKKANSDSFWAKALGTSAAYILGYNLFAATREKLVRAD
jgi:farnesyl-diphosphate farnesyltransferase